MPLDLMSLPVTRETELDRKIETRIQRIMAGQGTDVDRQEVQDLSIKRANLMERAGLSTYSGLKPLHKYRKRQKLARLRAAG